MGTESVFFSPPKYHLFYGKLLVESTAMCNYDWNE